VAGVTFHDELVTDRLFARDSAGATRFLKELKEERKRDFRREDVLILAREVEIL
jgi:hypothetical protein